MKIIPYGHQSVGAQDIKSVLSVLKSDWLTQGPAVAAFEKALCAYSGAKYAVCVSSGTAALHVACLAVGIKPKDEAITSPVTFIASANCVVYCGGRPVFADIEESTANIDCSEVAKKISPRTKALIPVHFAGMPSDMKEINRIAKKNKLFVIEDAAHALGATYKGKKIGSCSYSDMTIFSFHPVKAITAGEGGAILTNNRGLYERLLMFRNHGITKDKSRLKKKDEGSWYYEMQELGFNYRITDFQCAMALSQLKRVDSFIKRRNEIAAKYKKAFKGIPWISILESDTKSAHHLFVIRIDFKSIKKSKEEVVRQLTDLGIGTQVHYIPVHLQPYYQKRFGYRRGDYPKAEKYYDEALSIPLFPSMNDRDISRVISAVKGIGKNG